MAYVSLHFDLCTQKHLKICFFFWVFLLVVLPLSPQFENFVLLQVQVRFRYRFLLLILLFYIFLVYYYCKRTFVVLKIRVVVFDSAAESAVLSVLCTLLGLCFLALIYQNFAWQLLVFFLLQKLFFLIFQRFSILFKIFFKISQ